MPLLFGILAAMSAYAFARKASAQETNIVLLRAAIPFGGPIPMGAVAALLAAQQEYGGGAAAPWAFKVRIVGLPQYEGGPLTGLFLTNTLGARAGEFLEFSADKIQNLET